MNDDESLSGKELSAKIAKLVAEKGWNQEDFARISNLNRHTVRQILQGGPKRNLRNATISQCAEALDLPVHELRTWPIDKLLLKVRGIVGGDDAILTVLTEQATSPELIAWLDRHPERAAQFHPAEVTQLLEQERPGGELERFGVEHCVGKIEKRRRFLDQAALIADSEYLPMLEPIVNLIAEKIQTER